MTWSINPNSGRTDALLRLILILYAIFIWPFVVLIGLAAGVLYYVVDILSQLWHGDRGAGPRGGRICPWLINIFVWPIYQLLYIIGIGDEFPIFPDSP